MHDWIQNLISWMLEFWNKQMDEVIKLITQDQYSFFGGAPWGVIESVHQILVGIGVAMAMLFFTIGFFEQSTNFREWGKPEFVTKHLIRLIIAQVLVQQSLSIMIWIFNFVKGIILQVSQPTLNNSFTAPSGVVEAVNDLGFFKSIPAILVVLIGTIIVVALSFVILLQVYSRFFKVFLYAGVSPIFLSSYAWEGMDNSAKSFLKGYFGVCLEGLIIVVACMIFSSIASSDVTAYTSGDDAIIFLFQYMANVIFQMLVLIATVKLSSSLVKEMLGG